MMQSLKIILNDSFVHVTKLTVHFLQRLFSSQFGLGLELGVHFTYLALHLLVFFCHAVCFHFPSSSGLIIVSHRSLRVISIL